MPVWLGETGENSNTWFTEAISLFETNNIGWSWWPLKKLGNNNPLQIRSNPSYDSLVNFWNGKTNRAPVNVYSGLLELAAQAKCENNILHRDVIDAMFRQPFSKETLPFKVNNISSGTTILAVDYDLGRNGYAYFDKDTANYRISSGKESVGNRGRVYRNDGVDIYEDSIQKGDYYVGHIENGEWLQYTINVLEKAKYNLLFSVSSKTGGGIISVKVDNNFLEGKVVIPATGGEWEKLRLNNVELSKGVHQLRVYSDKGDYDFRAIMISRE
jgi:hypothetical protein